MQSNLWTPQNEISNRTSGHLIVSISSIEVSRGRFGNSRSKGHRRNEDTNKNSSTSKVRKMHWFSLGFKHIRKFEAISTRPPLTAPQPQALSENSPKKTNVFLAEFYWCFVNYEQRRRRRTINFARKRTSNGAADGLQLLLAFVEIVNGAEATSTFCRCAKNRGVALDFAVDK